MRWKDVDKATNIEDRRGGGFSPQGRRSGGVKIGGIGFFLALLVFLFTGQGQNVMDMMGGNTQMSSASIESTPRSTTTGTPDAGREFVAVVLKDTEDVWNPIFQKAGSRYEEPKLVIFDNYVRSACGMTSSATGPFYCPGDKKIYLDLNFFRQLRNMGVKGDFAEAYVIAHEVGHHVQKLQGISDKIMSMQRQVNKTQANQLSVLLELQADCYAGIYARRQANYQLLEDGDLQEALNAAASIGDDQMQSRAGQYVNPESFTHGSSAQRMEWLKKGILSGDPRDCDTFAPLQ